MSLLTKAPYAKLASVSAVILLLIATFTASPTAHAQNAAGAPTVEGTLEEGLLARADTSGITDADGLTQVSYSYEWIRFDGSSDAPISDATGSTYLMTNTDVGKALKVKVTFTDDGSNLETRTSSASALVAAAPTTYLVKNLAQTDSVDLGITTLTTESSSGRKYAQQFTVGDYGFTLQSIRLPMAVDTGVVPRVAFHWDQGGAPSRTIYSDFTNPDSIDDSTDTVEYFTYFNEDDGHLDLYAHQTYWIVIDKIEGTGSVLLRTTSSANEDANPVQGWSIGDAYHERASGTTTFSSTSAGVLKMGILGEQVANRAATGAPKMSGTFEENLVVWASWRDASVGDPDGFFFNHLSASPQWIRVDGGNETDIDGAVESNYRIKAADVGKQLKVRVSFTDDAGYPESRTSEASPTIAEAERYLVGNRGQDNEVYRVSTNRQVSNTNLTAFAQPFMTGSLRGILSGAKIETILPEGLSVITRIYTDDNGSPGVWFGALSSAQTLQPNTRYWLFVEGIGSGDFEIYMNSVGGTDEGGAANWSIDGNFWYLRNGTWLQWSSERIPILTIRMGLQGEEGYAPLFNVNAGNLYVSEGTAAGHRVGRVVAGDRDNHTITYSVGGTDVAAFNESFSLNAATGAITVKSGAIFDYEMQPSYSVTITATDTTGLSATFWATINVVEPRGVTGILEVGQTVQG